MERPTLSIVIPANDEALALRGVPIAEAPVGYRARGAEAGKKVRWTDGVGALVTLVRYRLPRRAWLLAALALGALALRVIGIGQPSGYMDEVQFVLPGRAALAPGAQLPYSSGSFKLYGTALWPLVAGAADLLGGIAGVRMAAAVCGVATVVAMAQLARWLSLEAAFERRQVPVLTRTEIDYRAALRLGERVVGRMWAGQIARASAQVASEIRRASDDVVCARALQTVAFVDATTGRPTRFPAEFVAAVTAAPD